MRKRRAVLAVALACAVLLGPACSGDETAEPDDTTTTSSSSTTTTIGPGSDPGDPACAPLREVVDLQTELAASQEAGAPWPEVQARLTEIRPQATDAYARAAAASPQLATQILEVANLTDQAIEASVTSPDQAVAAERAQELPSVITGRSAILAIDGFTTTVCGFAYAQR